MRWMWAWIGGIGLFLVGTGVGAGLGYVSLIVPRQQELRRIDRANPIVQGFSPPALLEAQTARRVQILHADADEADRSGFVPSRSWILELDVPRADRGQFVEDWAGTAKAYVRGRGGNVGSQGSYMAGGADGAIHHFRLAFEGKHRGTIQSWAWDRGDRLILAVTIHHR